MGKSSEGNIRPNLSLGDKFEGQNCLARGVVGFFTRSSPEEVGQYSPKGDSQYRVSEMSGNVHEWCLNPYKDYPFDPDYLFENADIIKDYGRGQYVVRGGSYQSNARNVRCACRRILRPNTKAEDIGFRIVFSPPSETRS